MTGYKIFVESIIPGSDDTMEGEYDGIIYFNKKRVRDKINIILQSGQPNIYHAYFKEVEVSEND